MESQKINLLQEFRKQLVNFLDEIIEHFPMEGDFVLIRMFIKDQVPVADILGRFIRDLLPLQEYVKTRNDKFFMENSILYTGGRIGEEKINHFKNLWKSDQLDENDKEIIWSWMDLFMKLANNYHSKYGYINGWEPRSVNGVTLY